VALEHFDHGSLPQVPEGNAPAFAPGGERAPVGAERPDHIRVRVRSPGKRPHPARAQVEQAKASVQGLDREGAAVRADGGRVRSDRIAANDAQRLRVDGIHRFLAQMEKASVRSREQRPIGGPAAHANRRPQWRSAAAVEAAQEEIATRVVRYVAHDHAPPVRSVGHGSPIGLPRVGRVAAQRNRSAQRRRVRVEDVEG
jgi:hypothetical protein